MSVATRGPSDSGQAGGWALGVCMGVSNILGYIFVLIVSRALGPADFGAFTAVNNTAMLISLPASAFQVVVAAHQARGHEHRSGIGLAWLVGGALSVVTLVISPVIAEVFHLDSPAAMVLVATLIPAQMLTGAAQGLLLGHRRFSALASVYVLIALARVLAAVVAILLDSGVVGVFGWLVVATWLPAVAALAMARVHVQRWRRLELGLVRQLLTSNGALAVLLAMTSTDVLFARHELTAHDAGAYAFAGLFGKVVFWGTQFVALTLVPTASLVDHHRRPVMSALGLVVGLGTVAAAVVAVAGPWLVTLLGGAQYDSAVPMLLPFVGLGTLWALCQVLLFADMARGHRTLTAAGLITTVIGGASLWVVGPDSAAVIITVYAVSATVVVIIGSVRLLDPGTATRH